MSMHDHDSGHGLLLNSEFHLSKKIIGSCLFPRLEFIQVQKT